MWKLSPEAKKIDGELHEQLWNPSLFFAAQKTARLIEQLAQTDEPAAIPSVASGLFSPDNAVHDAASAGVANLLELVPSLELVRMNEMFGRYTWDYVSARWNGLTPKAADSFLQETGDIAVGKLLCFHKSGYIRHSAIRFLSEVTTGEELRFLLVRQNDWVDSISQDAQAIVAKKLTTEYLSHFTDESNLLFHMLQCKRRDLSGSVSRYIDLLIQPEHRDLLQAAIGRADKKTGRTFFFCLLERDGDHLPAAVRAGLESSAPSIRTRSLKRAGDCLEETECEAVAERLLNDKFISVREEAYELKAKLADSPDSADDVWRQCMFDKSRALRGTAMFHLRKSGCDAGVLYRNRLSASPNCFPALSGLVYWADKSDLAVFQNYLKSDFASRRAEAAHGVGRVGTEQDVLGLQAILTAPSARVVRAAFNQLQPIAKQIDSKSLFGLIESCNSPAGVDAILRLLLEKGQWASLAYLIRGSGNPDHGISSQSKTLMDYMFSTNRVFTRPAAGQREQIQQAIDDCRSSMDKEFLRQLAFILSSFGFEF